MMMSNAQSAKAIEQARKAADEASREAWKITFEEELQRQEIAILVEDRERYHRTKKRQHWKAKQ